MRIAIYPGAFDPITLGHLDVATRACTLFDKLIIAIYDGAPKRDAVFSTEERLALATEAVDTDRRITVDTYTGLTIEFARSIGACALVRGLRVSGDFEYELQLAHMYRSLAPEIEVVCLMTSARYSFVSSSLVKEVARLGGDVRQFVPGSVAEALQQKLRT